MTTISSNGRPAPVTDFESVSAHLRARNGPLTKIETPIKVIQTSAEEKAAFAQRQADTAAAVASAAAEFERLRQEVGLGAGTALYPVTYTKAGQLSAEEKAASVQRKMDAIAEYERVAEKRRQEIEGSNVPASPTGQVGAENPAGTPVSTYFGYKESHEMYFLSNIVDLSLEHAKKQLVVVESMISTHEDAGMNVHGRYGAQAISDLNTYLAALKDYISKSDIGASPTPSEPAKGSSSTAG
jgi:hypothetical protein